MTSRYSSPPVAPADIAARLRGHFDREIPVVLVVARADREAGKKARFEASEARIELQRWNEHMRRGGR